jgi:hypothetical protein
MGHGLRGMATSDNSIVIRAFLTMGIQQVLVTNVYVIQIVCADELASIVNESVCHTIQVSIAVGAMGSES